MGWLNGTAHMEAPSNRLLFKDGISVPGLTLKYLFSYLSPQTYFSLFDQANSDLYDLIKDNNTGGPGIIFHRYHEAGETKIR